jgi:hypothetical protein
MSQILGEYGAWKHSRLAKVADRELHNKSIEYYYYYMVRRAFEKGAIPFVWETGSLFDRGTGKVKDRAIVNSMIRAATESIPATGVTMDMKAGTIKIGATKQLIATVSHSNASDKSLIWTSGKPTVASVSTNGLVTGVSNGLAVIKVITPDGALIWSGFHMQKLY